MEKMSEVILPFGTFDLEAVSSFDGCPLTIADGYYPLSMVDVTACPRWKFREWYRSQILAIYKLKLNKIEFVNESLIDRILYTLLQLPRGTLYKYPSCYSACSLNSIYPTPENYSASVRIACPEDIASPTLDKDNPMSTSIIFEKIFKNVETDECSWIDVPEPAFIAICSYLHPIDIVKNVSAVSRRWNWLVKKLHLCRQARINITDPPYHRYSLGVFLHEQGNWIEKLCINVTCSAKMFVDEEFFDLFPKFMPRVKVLDIGFFPCLYHFFMLNQRYFLTFFCFADYSGLLSKFKNQQTPDFYEVIFAVGFPHLRQLNLNSCKAIKSEDLHVLCKTKRHIDVLSVDGVGFTPCRSIASSIFYYSIKRLYLDGEGMTDADFSAISTCSNLQLLSISFCDTATDLALSYLKKLSALEHLHLRKGKDFSSLALMRFFALSDKNKRIEEFPLRLKFLNMGECVGINDNVVDVITKSCADLHSLCLCWCWSITEVGFANIVRRLRKLMFLDVRGMDMITASSLCDVPYLYLRQLRFLSVEQCCRVRISYVEDIILEMLNLRKIDLFILNYDSYYITLTIGNGKISFESRCDDVYCRAVREELIEYEGLCCMSDVLR
ncbi:unnamed protein product [Dracunculus medinensis]|uniref:F-box domain-containing protein n=1 Tax=Dracunculus medinensis TaxID=318479 RepID=A0A0N4U7W4_DRAME|nr:unnamed protein product [Dracunculus medinensis]